MPNALSGAAEDNRYSFTIDAAPQEIALFYETQLTNRGWKLSGSGQGAAGPVLLIYTKDTATLTVMFIPQPHSITYVVLMMP